MKILLLGSGGREHALAWKLKQSSLCAQVFIAPGNAGTAECGENISFAATDFDAVQKFCKEKKIDLLIVGPEEPLVKGLVDELKKDNDLKNLLIIGPSKEGAQLEGSKAFAKEFMLKNRIPTAAYKEFTADNYEDGIQYLQNHALPIVIKADGLAAGKGVVITNDHKEAVQVFEEMIQQSKFGEAGKKVVVEEFLDGIELSVFVLTDGKNYLLLPEAKDYKRIGEGDTGLNTGGMGAISPVPFADDAFMQKIKTNIIEPTIKGLQNMNADYKGFVFFGLIKVGGDPFVIEYNCRMGDPETEVVIPRIKNDLVELLTATAKGELEGKEIAFDERTAATVMAVSGGYPGDYTKGKAIRLPNSNNSDSIIFHAGTKEESGKVVTSGGRVLCVTSLAESLDEAIEKSYSVLKNISFENMYYRSDIGFEFLQSK